MNETGGVNPVQPKEPEEKLLPYQCPYCGSCDDLYAATWVTLNPPGEIPDAIGGGARIPEPVSYSLYGAAIAGATSTMATIWQMRRRGSG